MKNSVIDEDKVIDSLDRVYDIYPLSSLHGIDSADYENHDTVTL